MRVSRHRVRFARMIIIGLIAAPIIRNEVASCNRFKVVKITSSSFSSICIWKRLADVAKPIRYVQDFYFHLQTLLGLEKDLGIVALQGFQ